MSYGMDQDQPPLLKAIDRFLDDEAMSPVTFGRKALSDPHFVRDLKMGREPRRGTVARVRTFMATYRPEPQGAEAA